MSRNTRPTSRADRRHEPAGRHQVPGTPAFGLPSAPPPDPGREAISHLNRRRLRPRASRTKNRPTPASPLPLPLRRLTAIVQTADVGQAVSAAAYPWRRHLPRHRRRPGADIRQPQRHTHRHRPVYRAGHHRRHCGGGGPRDRSGRHRPARIVARLTGPLPVRLVAASSVKVTSRMVRLDSPVLTQEPGQVLGCGLGAGQARDGIDGLAGDLAGGGDLPPPGDFEGLAGVATDNVRPPGPVRVTGSRGPGWVRGGRRGWRAAARRGRR
jgi:hypothetical protein